jgi:VanZ family protein
MLIIRLLIKYKFSILYALFVLFLSLLPFRGTPGSSFFNIPYSDKIAHFILYGIMAFIIILETHHKYLKVWEYIIIILICLFFGGIIELLQMSLPGRSGEVWDLVANFSGSLTAIPGSLIINRFR